MVMKVNNWDSGRPVAAMQMMVEGGMELESLERNFFLREDGGLCFEIPPWQHTPVEMDHHIAKVKANWGNSSTSKETRRLNLRIANSKISHYVETVIGPFLDTYHRNIQTSYQQQTNKILRKIKDEVNAALRKKQKIYKELIELADNLVVPEMCEEERRYARTIASRHIAHVYKCTEIAKNSISKLGKCAEEMIAITRNHMQMALENATKRIVLKEQYGIETEKSNESACLKDLSKAAVSLGYELDLSLTNARRHNEQSCEKLFVCCMRAQKTTDESVAALKDNLYQCVYA
ncbi:unnamed protein product [Parnassius apollo]|uniref:(apollo) hypothetical protein n=1 Tax=Parnassius apollo TaxID=110799 RepID=A0A8S3VXY1_PARAO|nr:unnamed protein product [Parnassius apollo]